ncbi:MAG: YggT family protein [Wenzhouxiangellaceae bacterium]
MAGGTVGNAFAYLVETLFTLYLAALLLRILIEACGGDYYNPVTQVLVRLTEPLIAPLAALVPRLGRINIAAVVVLFALQTIAILIVAALLGWSVGPGQALVLAVFRLLRLLFMTWIVLIIAEVILSWVGGGMRHPIIPLIYQLTRPILQPIRRVVPPLAGLDLSPLIAIIGLQFLMILIGLR